MMDIDENGMPADLRSRGDNLAFMAGLTSAAGESRSCEGYLLELMAWASFADRDLVHFAGDPLPKEEEES